MLFFLHLPRSLFEQMLTDQGDVWKHAFRHDHSSIRPDSNQGWLEITVFLSNNKTIVNYTLTSTEFLSVSSARTRCTKYTSIEEAAPAEK